MSDAPILLTEQDGHVAIVRINRPKVLNALNLELMEQLAGLMETFDADENIRVIVLAGSDRAFAAAGPDTEWLCMESEWHADFSEGGAAVLRSASPSAMARDMPRVGEGGGAQSCS